MPLYDVTLKIQANYTTQVRADSEDEAVEIASAECGGLPYLGEEWDEGGELELDTIGEAEESGEEEGE